MYYIINRYLHHCKYFSKCLSEAALYCMRPENFGKCSCVAFQLSKREESTPGSGVTCKGLETWHFTKKWCDMSFLTCVS